MLNFIESTTIDYKPRAEAAAKARGFDLDQLLMSGASYEEILFVLGKYKTNEVLERAGGFYRVYIEEKEGARSPFGFKGLYTDNDNPFTKVLPCFSGSISIDENYTAVIKVGTIPQNVPMAYCILELNQSLDKPLNIDQVVEFLTKGWLAICPTSPDLNVVSAEPYFRTTGNGQISQSVMLTVVNDIEG